MVDGLLSCVLLADRHHGRTEGVLGFLEAALGLVVMAADETSLLEGAVRLRPEVAIVDLSSARVSVPGWLRERRQRWPDLKARGWNIPMRTTPTSRRPWIPVSGTGQERRHR